MSRWNAVKKTYAMSRRLHSLRGGLTLQYFFDALGCSYRHGASPENYFVLRFYELNKEQRSCFLTSGRSKAADRELNRKATEEEKRLLGRKELFNSGFAGLVRRESLYAPDCEREEFFSFLDRHEAFIIKPVCGTMGQGIERLCSAGVGDREGFYCRCREKRLLLEELIVQHPALAAINPSSINSVRINTARDQAGRIRLIGACLKCGGAEAVTDNFHSGGIAYPLELETGRVSGPGRNNTDIKEYTRHPGSDFFMPGFQVPFWETVKACAEKGMERVPGIGYVGWDIAVTPDGAELIEGNYHWPGGNIIQFDGLGKYPVILSCLGDKNE